MLDGFFPGQGQFHRVLFMVGIFREMKTTVQEKDENSNFMEFFFHGDVYVNLCCQKVFYT